MVLVVMMMVMFVLMLSRFFQKLLLQRNGILHHFQKLFTLQLVNGRGDDRCFFVQTPQHLHRLRNLRFVRNVRTAHDDRAGAFHLIVEEFTEITHVHFALLRIHHRRVAVQHHLRDVCLDILHRHNNIRELADAGGLDQNPLRMIRLDHFTKGCAEITNQ